MARLFSIFFCFVAPTLADYAVLPEEATGPNLLTRILMDACMHVASRLRVRRCAFLFPLPSSCSMSPLQMMSLITSLTPVSLPHISPQSFTITPLCQSLQSHLHPTPIVPKPALQGGCILIWFFPQTATLYLSLWTHLKVIPLLISETRRRNVKAGTCVCAQHDLDGRRDLPPHLSKHICSHTGALLPDRHGVIPRSPAESERCSVFDSVSVGATSFLLASETLSHYWPCDLTLSKSFTQAAAHCWALKVSGHKHWVFFSAKRRRYATAQTQTPVMIYPRSGNL